MVIHLYKGLKNYSEASRKAKDHKKLKDGNVFIVKSTILEEFHLFTFKLVNRNLYHCVWNDKSERHHIISHWKFHTWQAHDIELKWRNKWEIWKHSHTRHKENKSPKENHKIFEYQENSPIMFNSCMIFSKSKGERYSCMLMVTSSFLSATT